MIIFRVLNIVGDAFVWQFVGDVQIKWFYLYIVYSLLRIYLFKKLSNINSLINFIILWYNLFFLLWFDNLFLCLVFTERWAFRNLKFRFRSKLLIIFKLIFFFLMLLWYKLNDSHITLHSFSDTIGLYLFIIRWIIDAICHFLNFLSVV